MCRWPRGAREDAPHCSSPGRRKTTARQPLAPGNTAFVTRAGMTSRGGGTRSPHPLLLGPEQGTATADDATEAPPRVKHAAAAWPGNPVSGYSPERRKARTRRGACVRTCTAAWLAAEETWKPTIGRRTAMHGRRSRVCDGGDRARGHRAKCERGRDKYRAIRLAYVRVSGKEHTTQWPGTA